MNAEAGLQIDLIGALRRRGALIAMVSGAVVLAAYWVAMALPNQYTAISVLLVEPQSVSDRLVESGVRTSDINERLNLMTSQILSRPRLSRIIDEFELYADESEDMRREEVINLMRSRILIQPVVSKLEGGGSKGDTDINSFKVVFTYDNPKTASDVAQSLANDFIQEHIADRVQLTQKSLEFITAEQTRLQSSIEAIEQRIATVKNENAGRLPEDLPANRRLLERTLTDLRIVQRSLDLARGDEAFWASQALQSDVQAAPRDEANPDRRVQLVELELAELRAKGFTPKHPDVIKAQQELLEVQQSMRAQIEQRERDAADAAADADADVPAPSFAQRTSLAEKERAANRAQGYQVEAERLRAEMNDHYDKIAATPSVAEQLDGLHREYVQLNSSLQDFAKRRLEATVQAQLERRQLGEQFRILEAAYPPDSPSSPNRLLILVMGLTLGLGLGGAIALVMETSDSSVHGPRELQTVMSIPVLASIPAILLESDRAARLRRQIVYGLASASVVVFVLVGGALTYVFVNGAPGFVRALLEDEEIIEEPAPEEASLGLETNEEIAG